MLPIIFRFGPIVIYSYGLFIACGFLISLFIIYREVKKVFFDEEKVFDTVFLSVISGIFGARLFYIIEHFDSFGFSLLNWILINAKPGFSFWGGVGVGLATFLLMIKNKKLLLYEMLDIITLGFISAYIFGEIGAFLAGSEIGTPTKLPWGIIIFSTLKRHPINLYIAISSLLVLLLLNILRKNFAKKKTPYGSLFFSFVIMQSFFLFWIAFFKEDVIVVGRIFKVDNLIYFVLFLSSSVLLYCRLGRNVKNDLLLLKNKVSSIPGIPILLRFVARKSEKAD